MPIIIRYNPNLRRYATELRKARVLSEALFWNKVKNKQFNGLNFDRQRIIGNYIADFCCVDTGVVIEIDGCMHDSKREYDHIRNEYMKKLGLVVIRIEDKDIRYKMDSVLFDLSIHSLLQKPMPERKCIFVPDSDI
ncbi:MAG: DUF559 domain-containing protein [Proteobacteria bacterium]|nr:DUF559 domain-containing protein [Pseudomonadota bacterium]